MHRLEGWRDLLVLNFAERRAS
ncbi:hypothetical protein V12B01_13765 [Vibrio splendidus 12B01]|nr:hypothetical protein V12B01_13765 [Vibrio splendidus 12B01]